MDSHLLAQWNAEIESLIIAVSVGTKEKSQKMPKIDPWYFAMEKVNFDNYGKQRAGCVDSLHE